MLASHFARLIGHYCRHAIDLRLRLMISLLIFAMPLRHWYTIHTARHTGQLLPLDWPHTAIAIPQSLPPQWPTTPLLASGHSLPANIGHYFSMTFSPSCHFHCTLTLTQLLPWVSHYWADIDAIDGCHYTCYDTLLRLHTDTQADTGPASQLLIQPRLPPAQPDNEAIVNVQWPATNTNDYVNFSRLATIDVIDDD